MSLEETERIIREYSKNLTFSDYCQAITPVGGKATWDIEHGLSTTNVVSGLFYIGGIEVKKTMQVLTPNKIRVIWDTSVPVSQGDYYILVVSGGATNGLTVDSELSLSSMNAVQNMVITEAVRDAEVELHDLNSGTGAE